MGNEFKVGDRVKGDFGEGTVTMSYPKDHYKIIVEGVTGYAFRYHTELTLVESPKTKRVKFTSFIDEKDIIIGIDWAVISPRKEVEKSEKERMLEFFSRSAHDRK